MVNIPFLTKNTRICARSFSRYLRLVDTPVTIPGVAPPITQDHAAIARYARTEYTHQLLIFLKRIWEPHFSFPQPPETQKKQNAKLMGPRLGPANHTRLLLRQFLLLVLRCLLKNARSNSPLKPFLLAFYQFI